ncbi:MAG: IS1634 family transposase [Candidatus Rokubacteria bacterium]|nr:IS1634 family transposase [Candidatus Rokubacteria bacterium]
MASIQARRVRGRTYYSVVESRRINGKPRPVIVQYLGTAEKVRQLVQTQQAAARPRDTHVRMFGAVAALLALVQQLDLLRLIDTHVPKRAQGPSVGQYLVLAALNRCVAPTSKRGFGAWYQRTALARLLPLRAADLTSQRFWDHMARVTPAALQAIETALARRVVEQFGVDLRCLVFDCTNFDTFIDTATPAALPQRGHAKSNRTDLRVVCLGLLVSTDFHVPLFSHVYAGNQPDARTFAAVLDALVERYRALATDLEGVTLVFDKGNNAASTQARLDRTPFHFVGSLVPTQHPDLLALPREAFAACTDPRLAGVRALRTTPLVYGHARPVVVVFSPTLFAKQVRGIAQSLAKRRRQLSTLQAHVRRAAQPGARGKGYTVASLKTALDKLLHGQHVRRLLRYEIVSAAGKPLRFRYWLDRQADADLKARVLGKRILFTDQASWSTDQIILAYRAQHHVEAAFKQMKHPAFVGWEPMFHWTDQKIRVHAFYCVLALLLASLLHRQAVQAGLRLSLAGVLECLAGIQEVITLYPPAGGKGRPQAHTILTHRTPLQQQLFDHLRLERYLAT